MTVAKPRLLEARRLLLDHLDMHPGRTVDADLDPAEVGIVGGPSHVRSGTSYHLGKDQLILSRRPYSVVESVRDQRGLNNDASAIDIGWFRLTTRRGTFDLRHFSRWLVDLCKAGDPDTADIREVIYSLDGKTVRRWDDLGIRSAGDDSHLTHTHGSIYRDADGSCMVRLVTRYLRHIGLLPDPEEGFMAAISDADQKALIWRVEGIASGRLAVAGGPTKGEPVVLNVKLAAIEQRQTALTTAIASLDEDVAAKLRADFERIAADEAATLAAIEQAAAEDAVRDAELRDLVESGLSGEQDAQVVLRLIADKIRPADVPTSGVTPTS
ncbi:hypothetical protein K1W54_04520 [Micromonospora sp. CPCC 205371]|nr:hypothetical protein [Micromonospora sp. CPCC 205371]